MKQNHGNLLPGKTSEPSKPNVKIVRLANCGKQIEGKDKLWSLSRVNGD